MIFDFWWNGDVRDNLVADTYFAFAAFVTFMLLSWLLRFIERRRMVRFLGVRPRQTVVSAHVSYLVLEDFTVQTLCDIPSSQAGEDAEESVLREFRGAFSGPFITQSEVEALSLLRELIEGPIREGPATLLGVVQRRFRVRRVSVRLRTEPLFDANRRQDGLTVLVGTGKFNPWSRRVLQSSASFFRFDYDDRRGYEGQRTFYINQGRTGRLRDYVRENGRDPDPELSCELAIVQRIHDPESNSTVLMCCGLSAAASHAAVVFLTENWRSLSCKYPEASQTDFGVLIRLPGQERDALLDPNRHVQVVREVPGPPIPGSQVHEVLTIDLAVGAEPRPEPRPYGVSGRRGPSSSL